jgi:hypothetical protein
VLLALAVPLIFSGCASTTGTASSTSTALQTFDSVYAGAVQAETLILQETTAALSAKLISPAQAQQVMNVTDGIKSVLDAANTAAQAGNSGVATANAATATAAIAAISICLTAKPLTAQGFAVCTVKLTTPAVQS